MMLIKVLGTILSPFVLSLLISAFGLFLVLLRRTKFGFVIVGSGIVFLALFSMEPFARILILPLESRFAPLEEHAEVRDLRWIVVLGASVTDEAGHPATARLSGGAALRLMEGLRLHRALPESRLLLSGGRIFEGDPSGEVMAQAALLLGADSKHLHIHPFPRNTREEIEHLREFLGDEGFVLVTSAAHMPRAMAWAKRAGMNPVPSPTAWNTTFERGRGDPKRFLPSVKGLAISENAVHEYLGLAWIWLNAGTR